MHFERLAANSSLGQRQQAAMIRRTQRVQTASGIAHDSVGFGLPRGFGQPSNELHRQIRHIDSHDQHPVRLLLSQRRPQATERPLIGNQIADILADHGHISGSRPNHAGDMLSQCAPVQRQQRFVPAHAAALPSCQHEPGDRFPRALGTLAHEMMLAVTANSIGAICLLALLFSASASAADAPRKVIIKADKKTGKLVRVTVTTPKIVITPPSPDIAALVDDAAKRNDIDPLLVQSVIQVESNYNPYAVSSAGARGLMQLMPGTARDLGVTNTFDPRQNIEAGVKYLKYLKDLYQDERLALAAYNAGPGAVQKYKEVPPYPETQDYVQRVGERYEARKAAAIAPAVAPQPEPQPEPQAPAVMTTEETHPRLEQYVDEYGRLHLRTAP